MDDFDPESFVAELREQLESVPQEQKLGFIKGRMHEVPENYRAFVNALFELMGEQEDHMVVLVHGIRTPAVWQSRLEKLIQREMPDVRVIPIKYGFLDPVRFTLPSKRKGPIERVKSQLRSARERSRSGRISVIAHSFGTYVVSEILRREPYVKIHRLITCGSIIQRRFDWDLLPGNLTEDVVNDCGSRDFLPVFAKAFTSGYGPSGFYGFGSTRVRDRFHDVGHSGFFSDRFMSKYWLPVLRNGEIVASDYDRPEPPYILSLLSLFSGSGWVFLALFAGAVGILLLA